LFIDPEYTRPGIEAMLDQFKHSLAEFDSDEAGLDFNW